MPKIIDNIDKEISRAVAHYWLTRKAQRDNQKRRENLMPV